MSSHCELVMLILALTLHARVHTGEIYGGHEAAPHSRPYMVLLTQHVKGGGTKHCGGFLLNKDFVMTAAHCQAESYTVTLGLHDINGNNNIQHIPVKQSFPHNHYSENGFKNDIMLLKLSSKARFNENVRPISLAERGDASLPKSCSVSGWGITHQNEKYMSDKLMEVNVTLIDCKPLLKENAYCSKGETGPAVGDSGGPLVCEDGKAFGVVSSFKPDSSGSHTYCYTKISDCKDWIESIMGNHPKERSNALNM